jgi:hypothetical protein
MSWQDLTDGDAALAAFGAERLNDRVAYLGTVGLNGRPRVYPVTPRLRGGRLFLFMYPTSPKAHDLERGSWYALHAGVEDNDGGEGEFGVRGTARRVDDPADWELVRPGHPDELGTRYVLFELGIDHAFSTIYVGDDMIRNHWRSAGDAAPAGASESG